MSSAVLYFNRGTRCYIRLAVSVYSLRRFYGGTIRLVQEGDLEPAMRTFLEELDVQIDEIPLADEPVLVAKSSLWRRMKEDRVLFIDSDTLIQGPVDEFFEWIREKQTVLTWFADWKSDGPKVRRRIEEWSKVSPELIEPAISYGAAINTGVQGWTKGTPILPAYEELTRRGHAAGCRKLILDEIAMQLLAPKYPHYLAGPEWNASGKYGDMEKARIVHFHGRKHCRDDNPRADLWKEHYFELLKRFPQHHELLSENWGDRRLRRFRRRIFKRRRNMTIVSAVNPKYANRMQKNIQQWMTLPGLAEQKFIVFVNGFKGRSERAFLDYPNVKVIRWNYPHEDASPRELMLAAFVFGVAKHVKTDYWMKLDADTYPVRSWWDWPDYEEVTVYSHRWGYTKMKGDANPRHWFNRLDDVFRPDNPYFQHTFAGSEKRVRHNRGNPYGLTQRFASFCHIEQTGFTRRIAEHLHKVNDGRLVIPSQDTTSWYCSMIWGEKVKVMNMKQWFRC